MYLKALVVALSLLCAFAVAADERPGGFTLYPHVGMSMGSDIKNSTHHGLGVGYRFNSPWAIEAVYQGVGSEADKAKVDVEAWRIDGLYHMETSGKWEPYVSMGAGGAKYRYDFLPDRDAVVVNAGFGTKWAMSERTSWRADLRLVHGSDANEVSTIFSFGIQHRFGKRPDIAPMVRRDKPEPEVVELPPPVIFRTVRVNLDLKFDFDSALTRPDHVRKVEGLANFMKKHEGTTVTVEGHTDGVGDNSYNQILSEVRAEAVAKMLTRRFGLSPNRVTSVGYGESRPVATNDTEDGRQENRRVVAEVEAQEQVPN